MLVDVDHDRRTFFWCAPATGFIKPPSMSNGAVQRQFAFVLSRAAVLHHMPAAYFHRLALVGNAMPALDRGFFAMRIAQPMPG
jgi:hypothetical protein